MFYHDHAYGITRLNVYAGEAAGYLLTDTVEADLINGTNVSGVNPGLVKLLPDVGIPLIIQDKTFVDNATIAYQDPTWNWGTGSRVNGKITQSITGDLWASSVYMPAQNPWASDLSGMSSFGRWMYGPWFWPPTPLVFPPVANEYYDPNCDPTLGFCEPPMRPDMPTPSAGMEAFNDTPLVNGTVYPVLNVEPKTYRFRVLNAANDRFFNLHFYVADNTVVTNDGRTDTEVKMVPAQLTPGYPAGWSTDGREGGVPDPALRGPSWVQIGTEGGFLPKPVVVPPQPINWNMNATAFNVGNVTDHSLLLGCAERADVLVDFSAFPGKTLILYNDAPAAFPALNPQYDYYTNNPDRTDIGSTPTTQPGYGPNVRTLMQIKVAGTAQTPFPLNLAGLNAAFAKTTGKRGVFEVSQDNIIVPQAPYNSAYGVTNLPGDAARAYVQIFETSKTFKPLGSVDNVTIPFKSKAMHDEMGAAYDQKYGRMSGLLGLELPGSNALTQSILLYGYASPPIDLVNDTTATQIGQAGDGTQIWKITHNGVDTHPIHWHLFNLQLINRVAWDGALLPPDATELGWKETIRVNPLEDTIVAFKPKAPVQPFDVPNSIRLLDPTLPEGEPLEGPPLGWQDPGLNAVTVLNHYVNFGWEYVWHCHILSHEEMDMMHSLTLAVPPVAPSNLTAAILSNPARVSLTWRDNSRNETAFAIQRATDNAFTANLTTTLVSASANGAAGGTMAFVDNTVANNTPYFYRVGAINTIGDNTNYGAGTVGFPTMTVNSGYTNTASATAIINVSLSANPPNRAAAGTQVVFTATASGGSGSYQYKFLRWNGTTWTVVKDYNVGNNTWTWDTTGITAGSNFTIAVYARNVGSTASLQANASMAYTISGLAAATSVTLTPSPSTQAAPGTQVLLTAVAGGGTGTYQYKFLLWNGSTWTILKDYAVPGNTTTWNTTGIASNSNFTIAVYARSQGSTAAVEAQKSVTYKIIAPATSVTLTPTPGSPAAPGTQVGFVAQGGGGTGTYEYQYRLWNGSVWQTVKTYAQPGNSWTWNTTGITPGSTFTVVVYVRSAGSLATVEANKSISYLIQ
jgi:FtsP/CotA-like multicopper oxidase with cupredoxin domain